MRRLTPALIVAAAALSHPAVALADCPPGSWFCADEAQAPAQPPPEADTLPPPPPAVEVVEEEEEALPPPPARPAPHVRRSQPPVVIYQPAPQQPQIVQQQPAQTQIIIVAPGARTHVVRRHHPAVRVTPPPPPPPPARVMTAPARLRTPIVAPAKRRWQPEWGLNLRLQGLSIGGSERHDNGQGPHPDAGMGGFGLGLRYRPVPAFAVEGSFDIIGGTDYNGFDRVETPFSLSGLLYVNPRSRAQFYLTGGVHWSSATVQSENADPRLSPNPDGNNFSAEYSYFGGQGGIGLEFRVSRRLALNIDALAFIRKRTDDNAETGPAEFIDSSSGRTTNTSGGGLFRGGLTFWW
ncbi:outer membrane beta-barrel protein [Polyangium sp. y55x31]|uniref:outer membrane beta-barrel protein n=1 Tax=Polyangium sp. y55x31 TaxID=3042688 RepID=UPI0024829FF4|nr:outer membrane beta-barrel protein [Polyangium sp. y55x31]MDI1477431.1 outer membrane beta-barrel protein [Polyangium sp. y55x31]